MVISVVLDSLSQLFSSYFHSGPRYILLLLFCLFRATSMACGGSQARGLIRAAAAGLHHSHSNEGSEPHLQPTPKLTATLDP